MIGHVEPGGNAVGVSKQWVCISQSHFLLRVECIESNDHEYRLSALLFKEAPHCKGPCPTCHLLTGTLQQQLLNVLLRDLKIQ